MPKYSPLGLYIRDSKSTFEPKGLNLDRYIKESKLEIPNTFKTFSIENFKQYSIERQSDLCKLYLILDLDSDVDMYELFSYIELYNLEWGSTYSVLKYNPNTLILYYILNNLTLKKYKISKNVYQYVVELPGLGEYCPIIPLHYTNIYVTLKVNNNIKFKLGCDYMYLDGEERKTLALTRQLYHERIKCITSDTVSDHDKEMDFDLFPYDNQTNIKNIIIFVHNNVRDEQINPNYKSFFKDDIEPLEYAELSLVSSDFTRANKTHFELFELKHNHLPLGFYMIPLCSVNGRGALLLKRNTKVTLTVKLKRNAIVTIYAVEYNCINF